MLQNVYGDHKTGGKKNNKKTTTKKQGNKVENIA